MEIIKKGNKDLKYYYECENCGTVFTLTAEEKAYTNSVTFHCPVCEADLNLNSGSKEDDYYKWKEYQEELKKRPNGFVNSPFTPDKDSTGYYQNGFYFSTTSSEEKE